MSPVSWVAFQTIAAVPGGLGDVGWGLGGVVLVGESGAGWFVGAGGLSGLGGDVGSAG